MLFQFENNNMKLFPLHISASNIVFFYHSISFTSSISHGRDVYTSLETSPALRNEVSSESIKPEETCRQRNNWITLPMKISSKSEFCAIIDIRTCIASDLQLQMCRAKHSPKFRAKFNLTTRSIGNIFD